MSNNQLNSHLSSHLLSFVLIMLIATLLFSNMSNYRVEYLKAHSPDLSGAVSLFRIPHPPFSLSRSLWSQYTLQSLIRIKSIMYGQCVQLGAALLVQRTYSQRVLLSVIKPFFFPLVLVFTEQTFCCNHTSSLYNLGATDRPRPIHATKSTLFKHSVAKSHLLQQATGDFYATVWMIYFTSWFFFFFVMFGHIIHLHFL